MLTQHLALRITQMAYFSKIVRAAAEYLQETRFLRGWANRQEERFGIILVGW
jgi:hypothetical protein